MKFSSRFYLGVVAFVVFLFVFDAYARSPVPQQPLMAEDQAKAEEALFKGALHDRLARRDELGPYYLMGRAIELTEEGYKADEIVDVLMEERQRIDKLKRTVRTGEWIDPRARRLFILGAAGVVAIGKPALTLPTALAADSILDSVESMAKGKVIHWAHQELLESQISTEKIKREIGNRFYTAHRNFPELQKATKTFFEPEWQMNPDSSGQEILDANPDYHAVLKQNEILKNAQDQERMERITQAQLAALDSEVKERLKSIDGGVKSIAALIKSEQQSRFAARQAAEQAEERRIRIAGMKSVVFLSSTFVGFRNPEAGRALQTVGDAGFKVYEAVEAFSKATKGFSQLGGFATAALTGDIVGAILPVIGLFLDTGPSADEIIIEEIGRLREQVEGVRQQMHERFDLVDKRLVQIHEDMVKGLGKLSEQIRTGNKALSEQIAGIERELREQSTKLNDLYPLVIERTQAILDLIKDMELAGCSDHKMNFTEPMTEEKFRDCVGKIRTLASRSHLVQSQIRLPRTAQPISETLRAYPDATVNASVQKFQEYSSKSLPTRVVGPESWGYVARTHDEFLSQWPDHSQIIKDSSEYSQAMKDYRSSLESSIASISNDFVKYAELGESETQSPTTAVGTIIQNAREKARDIRRAMKDADSRLGEDDSTNYIMYGMGRGLDQNKWPLVGDDLYTMRQKVEKELNNMTEVIGSLDDLSSFIPEMRIKRDVVGAIENALDERKLGALVALNIIGEVKAEVDYTNDWTDEDINARRLDWSVTPVVHVDLSFRTECGGTRRHSPSGYGQKSLRLVVPLDGTRRDRHVMVSTIKKIEDSIYRQLLEMAFAEALTELENESDWRSAAWSCRETILKKYEKEFELKQKERGKKIAEDSHVREAIQEYNKEVATANDYLPAWARLALNDAIPLSDPIAALVTGQLRLPKWEETEDHLDWNRHEWHRLDLLEERISEFENILRSDHVKYMASEHAGYAVVTGTAYESLDPEYTKGANALAQGSTTFVEAE